MASSSFLWYSVLYLTIIVSFSEAIECKGNATYTLTFRAEWTRQSHANFPSRAHFSSLVGCSHKASYVMWTPGGNATTGVKDVAERGRTGALNAEMDQQITAKNAYMKYQGSGIGAGTGTSSIPKIAVNTEYPLVSFISMIAPSPDWFLGVHDFNLCNTTSGKWLDSRSRDLPLYDAGTDSGLNFTSADSPTTPPVAIELITNNTEGSLKGNQPLKRFGTFTFEKTFDSNPVIQPSATLPTNTEQTQPSINIASPTATINATKTPTTATKTPTTTTTTTGAANLVKQPKFVHLLLAVFLANLCL